MWGLATLLVGLLFGLLTPGLQNRDRVLRTSLVVGAIVGLVLAVFGIVIDAPALGMAEGVWTAILAGLVMAVLFVLGAWMGDVVQRYRTTMG